jgi:hypothetical protein
MECGECTLCCTLLPIKELNKPMNTPCVHCDKGCTIHATKPMSCSEFYCAYRQNDKAHISMRPDKCGVIFEKLSDSIMLGTCKPGYKLTKQMYGQIQFSTKEGFTIVMNELGGKPPTVFFSKGHSHEWLRKEMNELKEKRRGYSNV